MPLDPTSNLTPAAAAPLTNQQQEALKRLHAAATQFEATFVNMLFKSMRESAPPVSITGKVSNMETTFTSMLDEKRSEEMAQSGSLGIAKLIEQQLKASVLANPAAAAKARVLNEGDL
jgi:Rod binding domain-containing protein